MLALTVNCPTVSWSGHNIALRSRYVSLGWDWGQQQHRTHIRDQTAHNISQHLTTSLTAGELQVNTKLFQSVHSKTDRAGLAWVVTGNVISCRQRDWEWSLVRAWLFLLWCLASQPCPVTIPNTTLGRDYRTVWGERSQQLWSLYTGGLTRPLAVHTNVVLHTSPPLANSRGRNKLNKSICINFASRWPSTRTQVLGR